ncbi:MAG: phosphatidylglycerophosphatase A [Thiohalomonadales bacterium]
MNPTPFTIIFKNPIHFLSLGFGSGLSPIIPGTMGTLAAIPIYLLMAPLSLPFYIGLVVLMALLGFWFCGYTADALGVPDHGGIVWDEIVGYLITMAALPSGWLWIFLGFIVFRILDILKPWPISWVDRNMKGGVGIMLDDILAGLVGLGILHYGVSLWVS